jgi:thymidylate synthase (FAD)
MTEHPKINVLDHGHIQLIDSMGNDSAIIEAARTSYKLGTKITSDERTLLRFLLRHNHASPFESVVIKFHVKLPIFVERQWARHRTAGWNEVSARYSILPEETYSPSKENIKAQSKSNKQGREEELSEDVINNYLNAIAYTYSQAFTSYHTSIENDIARELARIELPLATYTEKVWWCNLRNIFNFLFLRMDSHAQLEIRLYANAMFEIVKQICPVACEAFEDYVLHAKKFSRVEMEILKELLCIFESGKVSVYNDTDITKPSSMTDREWKEFLAKLS